MEEQKAEVEAPQEETPDAPEVRRVHEANRDNERRYRRHVKRQERGGWR